MEIKNYIFGASGHAKVVLDVLHSNNIAVTAIVDDNPNCKTLLNTEVVSTNDFKLFHNQQFIIAIGNNLIRKNIAESRGFSFYIAIHSNASVSNFAQIGEGTVVMPLAVVNADAKIGNHCILNSRSIVEHDCVLENYVHISPNASIAGNVIVGEGTQVGIGATVIQGLKIGKWATIGAGSVIINDVPDYAVVVGNPGRIIKYNSL